MEIYILVIVLITAFFDILPKATRSPSGSEKISVNKLNKGNVSFKKEIDFYYELNDNKLIYVTPINKINVTSLKVSNIIFSNDNECYFISDDTLYYVNKDKIIKLMTYSEWKFNNDYIYIFK